MIFLLLLIFLFLYWSWITRRRNGEPPILPGSLPLIGHAYMIMFRNSIQLWDKFKELTDECLKKGHALYFLIGTKKIYVLTDPDDINLVSNTCLQKDQMFSEMTKRLVGEGLLFAEVTTWKRHRKLILPTFNQQVLDNFLPIFNAQAKVLVKTLEQKSGNGPFDSTNYLKQITLKTIFLTAMGLEINDVEALNYLGAFELAIDKGVERFQKFWLLFDFIYNFTNIKKEEESCMKTLQVMSDFVLSRKRKSIELRKKSNVNSNKEEKNIFLEQLLYFSGELSEKEIIDEVHTMILAGSDTSASVLVYALLLIGSYPKVQEKIFNELENIFRDSDRDVEKNDLGQMIYLEAVLRETMRYYVMAPFVARYIDKEIKLKNCILKPGNNCFFLLYGVHRHAMWGVDADQFRPERWLENKLPSNPNAFMAFSVGKRNCIGRSYAMMLMKTTLSHVLRRYTIHADHTQLKLKLDVLIKPATNYYITIENN